MYREQSLILVVQSQINQQSHHQVVGSVGDQYLHVMHYLGGGGEKFLLVEVEERWIWKDYNGNIVCGFRGYI